LARTVEPSRDGLNRPSEGEYLVGRTAKLRHIWRSDPGTLQDSKVLIGRPTGDGATLSDVDGHSVVLELGEELARWRHAEALDPLGVVIQNHLGCVPRQHDGGLLSYLQGAISSEMKWDRCPRWVCGPRCGYIDDPHDLPLSFARCMQRLTSSGYLEDEFVFGKGGVTFHVEHREIAAA
jgi:hypothetical protein